MGTEWMDRRVCQREREGERRGGSNSIPNETRGIWHRFRKRLICDNANLHYKGEGGKEGKSAT